MIDNYKKFDDDLKAQIEKINKEYDEKMFWALGTIVTVNFIAAVAIVLIGILK